MAAWSLVVGGRSTLTSHGGQKHLPHWVPASVRSIYVRGVGKAMCLPCPDRPDNPAGMAVKVLGMLVRRLEASA